MEIQRLRWSCWRFAKGCRLGRGRRRCEGCEWRWRVIWVLKLFKMGKMVISDGLWRCTKMIWRCRKKQSILWIMKLRRAQFLIRSSWVWVVLNTTSWTGHEVEYCNEFFFFFFLDANNIFIVLQHVWVRTCGVLRTVVK